MIVTKRALSRRTFLRGVGAVVALPLLDAMIPAMTATAQTPAAPRHRCAALDPEWTAIERVAITCAINRKCLREFAWPAGQLAFATRHEFTEPPLHHDADAIERLDGADQHSSGILLFVRDRVQTPVYAVDAIDVSNAGQAEHGTVAFGSANALGAV